MGRRGIGFFCSVIDVWVVRLVCLGGDRFLVVLVFVVVCLVFSGFGWTGLGLIWVCLLVVAIEERGR